MEHSQRFNSFSVRSALARLSLGATLLFACLTAQAGTLTLSNFVLTWTPGTTPEAGGGAIVHYDDGTLRGTSHSKSMLQVLSPRSTIGPKVSTIGLLR